MEQYKCQFEDEQRKKTNMETQYRREKERVYDMSRSAIMWKMRKCFVCT